MVTMGVARRLSLLVFVVSTYAAVIDDQMWSELERLDVCSEGIDHPAVGDTCVLCPAALSGVSMWRCCHDPRAFQDCTAALGDSPLDAPDKRKTKFFIGKKRATKFFLGKRSFGDRGNYASMQPFYDRSHLSQEFAFRRPQHSGTLDKRVKFFLG